MKTDNKHSICQVGYRETEKYLFVCFTLYISHFDILLYALILYEIGNNYSQIQTALLPEHASLTLTDIKNVVHEFIVLINLFKIIMSSLNSISSNVISF